MTDAEFYPVIDRLIEVQKEALKIVRYSDKELSEFPHFTTKDRLRENVGNMLIGLMWQLGFSGCPDMAGIKERGESRAK